jgi:hypothetical protein
MSRAVLVDTSVFAYALGGDHPQRQPCRQFLREARQNGLELHASVEMVQELTYHRMRKTDAATAADQGRYAARACILHAFDERVLDAALRLIGEGTVRGRDAVHAATAAVAGISTIVSTDLAFDAVLDRLDPSTA